MNKIFNLLVLFFIPLSVVFAQSPVSIEPAFFTTNDSITITFHAEFGNKELINETGDVYMYAGVATDSSAYPTDWRHVMPSSWNSFPTSTKLTRINSTTYSIKLVPRNYFQMGTERLTGLLLLFRNLNGSLVGRDGGGYDIYVPASNRMNWWNEKTFYQIFVRSFQDSNGDGIGDFNGIRQKIPYLKSLGIGAVWLMPINPSPSYHGYDVSDYKGVNPQYGTMAEFKQLVDSLHANGIKVTIDWVMNHCSSQHPWFTQAVAGNTHFQNFFRWSNTLPNQVGPWGAVCWRQNPTNRKYYYSIFDQGMPDLNYDFPPVKDSVFAAARYWLTQVGIDGFRCDAVQYLVERGDSLQSTMATRQIWSDFRREYDTYAPNSMTVGECWNNADIIQLYNDRLNFCFEFNIAGGILSEASNNTAREAAGYMQYINSFYKQNQYATFITNHDQNRAFSQLNNSYIKCRNAASFLFTISGIPFMYYGEELGMAGTGWDEDKRLPLAWNNTGNGGFTTGSPWRSLASNKAQANVATQENDPNSLLNHYRKLISLRNTYAALRKGDLYNAKTDTLGPVGAWYRVFGNENKLIIINPSSSNASNVSVVNFYNAPTGTTSIRLKNLINGVVSSYPYRFDGVNNYGVIDAPTLLPNELRILDITTDPVTSTLAVNSETKINIYPNPAHDHLYFELPENTSQADFKLIDAAGRTVKTGMIENNQCSTQGISAGVYQVVINYSGKQAIARIVIQ